ncbi:MAG: hypothetical protein ACRDJJ_10845 [Actinomycetota bacterium]
MKPSQSRVAFTLLVVASVATLVLTVTGCDETAGSFGDARGDVDVEEGPGAPRGVAVADIIGAEVNGDDSEVVFELHLGASVEGNRPAGALTVRWDVIRNGEFTWIVTADLGPRPFAALISQRTDYGASTLDGTLPGGIAVDGDQVSVTIRTQDLPAWPGEFDWWVRTTLDSDRTDPLSPVAEDRAPEGDAGHFAP